MRLYHEGQLPDYLRPQTVIRKPRLPGCRRRKACGRNRCPACNHYKTQTLVEEMYAGLMERAERHSWFLFPSIAYHTDIRAASVQELREWFRADFLKLRKAIRRQYDFDLDGVFGEEWQALTLPHIHWVVIVPGGVNPAELQDFIDRKWAKICRKRSRLAGFDIEADTVIKTVERDQVPTVLEYTLKRAYDPRPGERGPVLTQDALGIVGEALGEVKSGIPAGLEGRPKMYGTTGSVKRAIIRREREMTGRDGNPFDWRQYRSLKSRRRYWHQKAEERRWDSRATTMLFVLDERIAEMEKRKPEPGGWRYNIEQPGNRRVAQYADGSLRPVGTYPPVHPKRQKFIDHRLLEVKAA